MNIPKLIEIASQRAAAGENPTYIVNDIMCEHNIRAEHRRLFEEAVLANKPLVPFDCYEIRKVREYADPNGGTFCEPFADEDEEALREFWTLYGHTPGEGVQDIADRDTLEQVIDLYQRITGNLLWPQIVRSRLLGEDYSLIGLPVNRKPNT